MLNRPSCLHIPFLHEDAPAKISWGSEEGAYSYQLECVFDESFEEASEGRSWTSLESSGKTWDHFEGKGFSWDKIESLSAGGVSWQTIELENLTWDQIERKNLVWSGIETLPVRFIIYDGPGEPTRAPDQGLTWNQLDSKEKVWEEIEANSLSWQEKELLASIGLSWSQHESKGLSWEEIESAGQRWSSIEREPVRGLKWESIEAQFFSWDEIERKGLTWLSFEQLPPDIRTHKAFVAQIPLFKKTASYRVRGFDGSSYSSYLTSALIPIIPVFHREGSVEFSAVRGERYTLQLLIRNIKMFREIWMRLIYNPVQLTLRGFSFNAPDGQRKDEILPVQLIEGYQEAGRLWFKCNRRVASNTMLTTVVTQVVFTANRTGDVSVKLS